MRGFVSEVSLVLSSITEGSCTGGIEVGNSGLEVVAAVAAAAVAAAAAGAINGWVEIAEG